LEKQPISGVSSRLYPRGKLKIFLGASPGVGKTFSMLQAGVEKKKEGVDVVVGLVETHKRKETEEQLKELEVIPRKEVHYRGHTFQELDLDAVLQRKPQLVLVDECAHSNIAGMRHPKRFNDIEEILENGIDVYTTLNIQHIESLKDVISNLTHVAVRETIPDSFFESADEVQLIDLPPDDLLQRLAEGKVYIPEQAKAAVDHFFSKSNLLSLRELALKYAVSVVDEEMSDYVEKHGIKGPWLASDRLMVCVNANAMGPHLVRTTKRLADRLQAKWIAVTVETPLDENRSIRESQFLTTTLRLAENLGGEVVSLDGTDVAETLADYAISRNITEVILGRSGRKGFIKFFRRLFKIPIAEKILLKAPSLSVRILSDTSQEEVQLQQKKILSPPKSFKPYIYSLLTPLAALLFAQGLSKHLSIVDVSMIFFISILFISIRFGLWPSLWATFISIFVYDYYFIEPKYVLGIDSLQGWLNFFLFVTAAVLTSNLASRARDASLATYKRLRQIRFLTSFGQRLLSSKEQTTVLRLLCHRLSTFLHVHTVALGEVDNQFKLLVQYPIKANFTLFDQITGDFEAAHWCYLHGEKSGFGTDTFVDANYIYIPLKIGNDTLGVVGLGVKENDISLDNLRLAQLLVDLGTLAIDRLQLLALSSSV
jgi:two-component system sensor histidine kinase KdpD